MHTTSLTTAAASVSGVGIAAALATAAVRRTMGRVKRILKVIEGVETRKILEKVKVLDWRSGGGGGSWITC